MTIEKVTEYVSEAIAIMIGAFVLFSIFKIFHNLDPQFYQIGISILLAYISSSIIALKYKSLIK